MGRFKFGDIIENGWAADSNPTKRGIYLWSFNRTGRMNPGQHVKLLHDDGRTGELRISDDDKMTVVGTIFDDKVAEAIAAKDAEIERLNHTLDMLWKEAESAYVQALNRFSKPQCLGWEAKVKTGVFGKAEYGAHKAANELIGRHQGIAHAVKTLRNALKEQADA